MTPIRWFRASLTAPVVAIGLSSVLTTHAQAQNPSWKGQAAKAGSTCARAAAGILSGNPYRQAYSATIGAGKCLQQAHQAGVAYGARNDPPRIPYTGGVGIRTQRADGTWGTMTRIPSPRHR